jgi:hypothetical protein
MHNRVLWGTLLLTLAWGWAVGAKSLATAGEASADLSGYKVLEPVRHGNLTVFPVVAARTHDTSQFLTLDEGLKSGEVVVTESGMARGLIRRPPQRGVYNPQYVPSGGAQVNRLVLINNAKRPLILLAGEIVIGGKQDRVIGKDRLVPPESDPIDLSVFCVEHGRWVATSDKFGTLSMNMAAPSVRGSAMAHQDQQMVWDQVGRAKQAMSQTVEVQSAPAATRELSSTTSYAKVMQNEEVKQEIDSIAKPVQESYASTIRQLRDQHAVGVVVAVNGQLVWADVFASTSLLEKYWPKLIRSYATDAVVTRAKAAPVSVSRAQSFLENVQGEHETIDSEPGLYRHTEIDGDGFKVFELTSLLPKTGFSLHTAKMAE